MLKKKIRHPPQTRSITGFTYYTYIPRDRDIDIEWEREREREKEIYTYCLYGYMCCMSVKQDNYFSVFSKISNRYLIMSNARQMIN